jgi:transketolase
MRNSFADQFLTLARLDPRLILVTGDLGFGVLDQIAAELPNQYINAGITEQSMMSMAAGLASEGYRPFVYSIANFPTLRCLEQIRNDVCYMNNPVTIIAVGAGLGYGNLGYTHHAVEDIAIMRALPNLSIYSPADSIEVRKCLSHILYYNSPAYMRLGKGGEPAIHSGDVSTVNGPLQISEGQNGFIAFTGGIGSRVLEAEKLLNLEGFYPTIFSNPRLSTESLESLINSTRDSFLLTVEEHSVNGGFGSWLLEAKSDLNSNVRISRLGLDQENIALLGSQAYLLDHANITARGIADKFIALAKHS